MQRKRESGDIGTRNEPAPLPRLAGAVANPEQNARHKKRGGVNLGLVRTEPHARHQAGANGACPRCNAVTGPAREEIRQQRTPGRSADGR